MSDSEKYSAAFAQGIIVSIVSSLQNWVACQAGLTWEQSQQIREVADILDKVGDDISRRLGEND